MNRSRAYLATRTAVRALFWALVAAAALYVLGTAGHWDLEQARQTEQQLTHLPAQ